MFESTRRAFLAQTAALVPLGQLALADPLRRQNLGVQLYTVRNIIASDPAGVLKQIHDIGYAEIEATEATVKLAWDAIKKSRLKWPSVHLNTHPSDEELEDMKKKGFEYVVVPYIPVEQRGGVDVMKKLAASLQDSGQRAQQHGLQLCYHNHAFEFQPMDNTTPLEILMKNTDPDVVKLELDIFWATVAGNDPVDILKRYSGRIPLLHLKDKEKGVPAAPQYNENVPKDTFKEIGNGSIDIPAVLKAADTAGVKHYFVEQDQTPDPIASLRQSYNYLKQHFA